MSVYPPELQLDSVIAGIWYSPYVDCQGFSHMHVLAESNVTYTIYVQWSLDAGKTTSYQDITSNVISGEIFAAPIRSRWMQIGLLPSAPPQIMKCCVSLNDEALGLVSLTNAGAGAKIYKAGNQKVRSLKSNDGSVTITELLNEIDLSVTGTKPTITAVNDDIQIASVVGGYTIDVGSAPGNSVVKITNGTGDNLNGVSAVALGNLAGAISQGQSAVAVGFEAGRYNQLDNGIAIGTQAAQGVNSSIRQGSRAIALGAQAGRYGQGDNAIAIGFQSSFGLIDGSLQQPAGSIAIGSGCETPGAINRLAFKAETVITPSASNQVALSALLPLQWNGALYRIPALPSNATDVQKTALTAGSGIGISGTFPNFTISSSLSAVNNDVQITSVAGGYTIDVGSAPANGVVKLTNGSGDNLNAANSVAIGSDSGTVNQGVVGGSDGGAVAIGVSSGRNSQGQKAIAIGRQAGFDSQGVDAVAIGGAAAYTTQGSFAVSIGVNAGNFVQGSQSVAIGNSAGRVAQGGNCVSIGVEAGRNSQDSGAVAIGNQAGLGNPSAPLLRQGQNAVAIGSLAGRYGQDAGAIAIGNQAAQGNIGGTSVQPARSIAIGNLCETPGAVDRLAFKAETVVTPGPSNQQALSALIPLQWNGTLYRIPALASNATDLQTVTLTSAGGTVSLVNDGTGPTLAVKGITAGSNVTLTDSGTAVTINSSGAGFGARIYAFIQMVNNVFTGHGYSFTGSPVFSEMTSATATYFSSLSPEFTIVSNAKLRYIGTVTRQFRVGSYFFATVTDGFAIGVAVNDVLNTNTLSYWRSTDTAHLDTGVTLAQNDTISIHATRQNGTSTKDVTSFSISIVALN